MDDENKKWEGTTYGNAWMHRTLIKILRNIDIRFVYVFTAIFVIPVCLLLRAKERNAMISFFREHLGYSRLKSFWMTCKNHYVFGQIVIDRFAMYGGKRFDVEVIGYDYFLNLAAQESGFVQMSAHVGNYELAGYTLVAETKRINALIFKDEKAMVLQNRKRMFGQTNIRMIPMKEDMSHLFEIDAALQNGEIVSMPADRVFGAHKTIDQDVLGSEAHLPLGPFATATLHDLDVLAVNVMKVSTKKYVAYVTPLDYPKDAPRKVQIQELSRLYAQELTRVVKMYPTQWFNYFDFWNQ